MKRLDGQSLDNIHARIEELKSMFPEAVSEGRLDYDLFMALLGDEFDNDNEKYQFTWKGKLQSLRLAQKRSSGTLRPDFEESRDFDTTGNLYIEGDNLEVLKLLQQGYLRKVKMIYIDPPYNTGNDFIYEDDFKDPVARYKEVTGQGMRANPETAGRYHSNWLNMMYPRLKIAKTLLRDDGVIFISIDDAEQANLKKMCDEVFGEENFIATLVWDKNRKNDAKYFSVGHEYMLVYFRNKYIIDEHGVVFRASKEGVEEVKCEYDRLVRENGANWDAVRSGLKQLFDSWSSDDPRKPLARFTKVDEKGPFRDDGNISWPGGGGPTYEVIHPITGKPCKVPDGGWRYPNERRMKEEIDNGRVVFGIDETTLPRIRRNLFESDKEVMRSVTFSYAQTSTQEFNKIFDGIRVFENPKHFEDIKSLLAYLPDNSDAIVLDFFSGSATTAHAVMQLNAEDGGNRKFIMVQIPEPTDPSSEAYKAGYKTIAEIGMERIRRAGDKIKAEAGMLSENLDTGFRVFKLDTSNLVGWDDSYVPQDQLDMLFTRMEQHLNTIKHDRRKIDVVYEIFLKYGIPLTEKLSTLNVDGKTFHVVGENGYLFICLDNNLTVELVEQAAQYAPGTMIFCEECFADNSELTNAGLVLKKAKIELRWV